MKRIYLVIFVISLGFVLGGCSQSPSTNTEEHEHEHEGEKGQVTLNKEQFKALGIKLGGFQMRNLTTVVKVNGQLEISPESRADITTLMGGNVKEIKVFHGDKVRKGQPLAVLEHPDYIALQEDYAEIANKLDYLKQEYERQEELYKNNAASGKAYQKAKSGYYVALSKYKGLQSRLELLNISPEKVKAGEISSQIVLRSPIDGYVNEVDVKVGTYVGPQDRLFEITDHNAIHADFMVYEKDVYLLRKGQIIHFRVSNMPGQELTAKIFAIGKEFEPNTRAVHVHAAIDSMPEALVPGMYLSGHLHTDEKYTRALPNDAIVKEGTKSYIFVLADEEEDAHGDGHGDEEEFTFKKVAVITGKQDEGFTEIKLAEGVGEDDKIVQNAAYYLLADMNKEETGEHGH